MKIILLASIAIVAAFAQSPPTGEATHPIHHEAAKPSVSPEARAKYWRAYADLQSAKAMVERSDALVKAAVDSLIKECVGTTVILDPNGEPTCAPPKEAAKTPVTTSKGAK